MIKEVEKSSANPFGKRLEYTIEEMIVGYLDYSLIYDRIEIDNIYVSEEYRGKKIGTELLKKLISIAENNKIINITLEVRKSNEVARHLYNKMGFIEVAIRKYYYGDEDAILMEKKVM